MIIYVWKAPITCFRIYVSRPGYQSYVELTSSSLSERAEFFVKVELDEFMGGGDTVEIALEESMLMVYFKVDH